MYDCTVLTETFNEDKNNMFSIDRHSTIFNEGNINKNYGILIDIKNTCTFHCLKNTIKTKQRHSKMLLSEYSSSLV